MSATLRIALSAVVLQLLFAVNVSAQERPNPIPRATTVVPVDTAMPTAIPTTPPVIPTATSTPTPTPTECVCKNITVVCLDPEPLYTICQNRNIEGCAKQEICTLYIKKGSPQCAGVAALPGAKNVLLSEVPGVSTSRLTQPKSSQPLFALLAPMSAKLLPALKANLISKDQTDSVKVPTTTFLAAQCLIVHETDHLCRKANQTVPCAVEPPALEAQTGCFLDAINQYCQPTPGEPQPNSGLCEFACKSYVGYRARASFSSCFCGWSASTGNSDGERACCECADKCPTTPVPAACAAYSSGVTSVLDTVCPSLIDPRIPHSCAYYGQWPPPWNQRIPRCDRTSSPL